MSVRRESLVLVAVKDKKEAIPDDKAIMYKMTNKRLFTTEVAKGFFSVVKSNICIPIRITPVNSR